MSTLEHIQSEINTLSIEEFWALSAWFDKQMTPEMIADNYEMTLDQVEAALSFYAENKIEIDTQIADEDAMTPPLHV